MSEDLNALIEKIQTEGVLAAEKRAGEIEERVRQEAEAVIQKAKLEAQKILSKAKEDIAKIDFAEKTLLKQAGRDFLLNLRKEIDSMLNKIVSSHIAQALGTPELLKIINALVKEHCASPGERNIVISISRNDLEKLEKGFLSELKEEIKHGVAIKPSDDISYGFIISYDAGKSHFDFSDKALAEYIGTYLKPKLAEILK